MHSLTSFGVLRKKNQQINSLCWTMLQRKNCFSLYKNCDIINAVLHANGFSLFKVKMIMTLNYWSWWTETYERCSKHFHFSFEFPVPFENHYSNEERFPKTLKNKRTLLKLAFNATDGTKFNMRTEFYTIIPKTNLIFAYF